MKKGRLLNAEISALIAGLGHTDMLAISDAGLPVAANTTRIDLALMPGVPDFLAVLDAVTSEMQVQAVLLACEVRQYNPLLHRHVLEHIERLQDQQRSQISVRYITHTRFKQRTGQCRAVIRSGECSPYANIILQAGVTF